MYKKIPHALTIAGSDSSGGAGIQADLKTFAALRVYGSTAITALTAQNSIEVRHVVTMSPKFLVEQINVVFDDMPPDAIKIGMVANADIIQALAENLRRAKEKNIKIILDPVMIAKSGDTLLDKNAINALKKELIPLAYLLTPNIPEAAQLLNQTQGKIIEYARQKNGMHNIAHELIKIGAQNILLKGGHLTGKICTDVLHDGKKIHDFSEKYIKTKNTHGTGCTISAAITAEIAKGKSIKNAVKNAHQFTHQAIRDADQLNIAQGHGPLNHFNWKT